MMAKKKPQPSDLELQVLGVLWSRGATTVREILESLPDGKRRAYTSVLSVVQVMEKKGLVKRQRERDGLAHVFRAAVSRSQIMGPLLEGMIRKLFGGSPAAAVQQLLTETRPSANEIQEVRRFLDEFEKGQS